MSFTFSVSLFVVFHITDQKEQKKNITNFFIIISSIVTYTEIQWGGDTHTEMTREITVENGTATNSINKKALRLNTDKMHLVYRRPVRVFVCSEMIKLSIIYNE